MTLGRANAPKCVVADTCDLNRDEAVRSEPPVPLKRSVLLRTTLPGKPSPVRSRTVNDGTSCVVFLENELGRRPIHFHPCADRTTFSKSIDKQTPLTTRSIERCTASNKRRRPDRRQVEEPVRRSRGQKETPALAGVSNGASRARTGDLLGAIRGPRGSDGEVWA